MPFTSMENEEILIGLIIVQVTASFAIDFAVLFMYKTLNIIGQSTLSAFILFILSFIIMTVYTRSISKEVFENII